MPWLAEQYAYMNAEKYEDKGKFSVAPLSFLEKQKDGTAKYSRYFGTFVGKAYDKISANPDVKSFKLIQSKIENTPYTDKQGNKQYPKSSKCVIWDIDDITYIESEDSNPF